MKYTTKSTDMYSSNEDFSSDYWTGHPANSLISPMEYKTKYTDMYISNYSSSRFPSDSDFSVENQVVADKMVAEGMERPLKKRRLESEQQQVKKCRLEGERQKPVRFREWKKQHFTFHRQLYIYPRQQASLLAVMGTLDEKAKPIDRLGKYLNADDGDVVIKSNEPLMYLNDLAIGDMEDLLKDIKVHLALEKRENLDFWGDITIIVKEELYKLRREEAGNRESLPYNGKANRARLRIMIRHNERLYQMLAQLEQRAESKPVPIADIADSADNAPALQHCVEQTILTKDLCDKSTEECDVDVYSSHLVKHEKFEPETLPINLCENNRCLEFVRQQAALNMEGNAVESEERNGMTGDEAICNADPSLMQRTDRWYKCRPRKPQSVCYAHIGLECYTCMYNQTHCDMKNPPRQIVLGFKFNIFYPDLINKKETPKYTVKPCRDNEDYAIICFSAGSPYDDISFKIVNREWEQSYEQGFLCQFHDNVFQLWFSFKRKCDKDLQPNETCHFRLPMNDC